MLSYSATPCRTCQGHAFPRIEQVSVLQVTSAELLEKHAVSVEQELSLRLLSHYASSVRLRHYHLSDLVTVRVERSR